MVSGMVILHFEAKRVGVWNIEYILKYHSDKLPVLAILLNAGADVDAADNIYGNTPLMRAASRSNFKNDSFTSFRI